LTLNLRSTRRQQILLLTLCTALLTSCAPDPSVIQSQALEAAAKWFDQAKASQSSDDAEAPSCHAFGLLKFTDADCTDMIEHAARLDASTRRIERVELLKCFGQGAKEVCGEFAEIWFNTKTVDGVGVKEGMVLKRDNEQFRLYWYRSDTLFTELTDRAERQEAGTKSGQMAAKQEQLDAIYTQMVERDRTDTPTAGDGLGLRSSRRSVRPGSLSGISGQTDCGAVYLTRPNVSDRRLVSVTYA